LHELNEANKKSEEYRVQYERFVPAEDRAVAEKREQNALRAFLSGESSHVDFDFTSLRAHVDPKTGEFELRDLLKVTDAGGGDTVPTAFLRELYEHMIHASAIRQTNVRILQTASGENIELPKTLVFGTAAIVGEGSAAAEADPTFDKVTLGSWKYAQLLQVSSELLSDTGVDMQGFIARDLGRALGQATGSDFVVGSGTNAPRGVMVAVAADVGTAVQVASATVESDNLIDLMYHVIPPYRVNGFWLMADSTEKAIRKIKNADDQYVWQPGLTAATPSQILGRPVVVDPFVDAIGSADESIAFGDFSGFVIREAGPTRVERSDDFAFSSDLISFRAIQRVDSDLIDLNAIDVLDTD
jgi:HK97 family phage major capsid protein